MRTKEQWLSDFKIECYKENSYTFHPYGCMLVKPNKKEVVCFYPILSLAGEVLSFVVNEFRVKNIDNETWFRECSNHNYANNCTKHRWYDIEKAYKIYKKYFEKNEKKLQKNFVV